MVLCYRCGCYGHIAPHCESERRRRSDEFYYDSPGSWSDHDSSESSDSSESDEWDEREEPVISDSINSAGVYVIVLDDGTRYVGKSTNVNRRISQHLNPKAIKQVAWCKKGGIRQAYAEPPITKPNADLSAWEQNETIAQMMKHGVNRVRGWEFTSCRPFSPLEYELFKKLAFSKNDLCRTCGYGGHMAAGCYSQKKVPWLKETF